MNNIQENDHGKNIVDIGAFQDRNQSTAWFLRGFQFENLIVSSHFCSEEGVFLFHWYWGQTHLKKKVFSSTYWWSRYQSRLKPSPRFAKLVSEKGSPQAPSPSLSLFCCLFCLCLCCLSKGERSPQAALSRAKRPPLSLSLCSSLSLSLSLLKISHLKPPSPMPRDRPSPFQMQQAGTHKMGNNQTFELAITCDCISIWRYCHLAIAPCLNATGFLKGESSSLLEQPC